ncbi:hypothetical protein [uncultured Tateyamaria sp.]|uniref:hypothetical protein n=1 Tax=uncultured Tateyamaria sp. TaxID=455651 RepID=UPI0026081BC9|nr:hypothetical protein [uncultured Tateyamaria sp.]
MLQHVVIAVVVPLAKAFEHRFGLLHCGSKGDGLGFPPFAPAGWIEMNSQLAKFDNRNSNSLNKSVFQITAKYAVTLS